MVSVLLHAVVLGIAVPIVVYAVAAGVYLLAEAKG